LRYGQARDVAVRISDLLWEQFKRQAKINIARPLATSGGARMTRSSPAADAALACIATPVLQAADTETAAQRLQWLTSSMRRRGFSLAEAQTYWRPGNSPSLDALRRAVLSPTRSDSGTQIDPVRIA
jgi:hypothetical protein